MKKMRVILFPLGDEMRLRLRKMKLTVLLIFLVVASFGNSFSQVTLSLHFNKANIHDVLGSIEKKTDYIFLYKDEILNGSKEISVDFVDAKFDKVLKSVCEQGNVDYEVREQQIILKEKANVPALPEQQQPRKKEISGRVSDSKGQPIPGVTIVLKGTTTGITTDNDGKFQLSVPLDANTLVFSFVGMKTQEIPIAGKTSFIVAMEEETVGVDEVVVVGYGTQKKSDITGTVASLPKDRLEMTPNLNIAQAIQGSIPGVMIQTTSAGAAPSEAIMIRGRNSILASTDPLIVVDGIPYGGQLSDLNPNDVQSIEVLKDASAAAIYGSRGSNGVILITTKEGSEGKASITYDGKYSIQSFVKLPDIMDGKQFYDFKMTRLPSGMTQSEQDVYDSGKWVNWLDLGLRNGHSQQHNIAVSGGFQKTKYYIAGSWLNVRGLVVNDNFQRITNRINVDTKIAKWLTIGTRTQLSIDDMSGVSPNMGDLFFRNPLATAYDENGNLTITPILDDPVRTNPLETTLFKNIDKSY